MKYWFNKIIGAVINAKLGLISFTVNFSIVYYLNHEFGMAQAIQAGFTGGLGSFFMGGIFGRLSERFSEIKNPLVAYPLGSVVPTLLAYTFIFAAHVAFGTPRAEMSSLVPMFISMFINTPATMFMLRRGYFRQNQEKPAVKDRVWKKKQEKRKRKEAKRMEQNGADEVTSSMPPAQEPDKVNTEGKE